jgi:hypothetical protein
MVSHYPTVKSGIYVTNEQDGCIMEITDFHELVIKESQA